eukprot:1946496-Rhodomonas_salina.2
MCADHHGNASSTFEQAEDGRRFRAPGADASSRPRAPQRSQRTPGDSVRLALGLRFRFLERRDTTR